MKSLLYKDFYNLTGNNSKYVLLVLVVFAVTFIPSGYFNYLIYGGILFAMLAVTSFSYDDLAKWNPYALAMPIRKRDLVTAKYLLAVLSLSVGILACSLISLLVGTALGQFDLGSMAEWRSLLGYMTAAFLIGLFFDVTIIPLVFHFGVEKARFIIVAVVALPTIFFLLLSKNAQVMAFLEGPSGDFFLMVIVPILILLWAAISLLISCRVFEKKEF